MSSQNPQAPTPLSSGPHMTTSQLPISQLESLKFKANQIIDSIQALQHTITASYQPVMPSWPDILNKYNIILSQTHSFSMSLSGNLSRSTGTAAGNPLERIALHPSQAMTDAQLDGEVIPLLRNQQTLDVLRLENETVRRLAEHMVTRGSLSVLGAGPVGMGTGARKETEYEDVLRECEEIRSAHDRRVERAVRAVTMLREKFDWKQRVEVEVEEPEELEWDPRARHQDREEGEKGGDYGMGENNNDEIEGGEDGDGDGDGDGDVGMESPGRESSDEGDEVQALVDSAMDTLSPISTTVALGTTPNASII